MLGGGLIGLISGIFGTFGFLPFSGSKIALCLHKPHPSAYSVPFGG
jgi:hypothetical protein